MSNEMLIVQFKKNTFRLYYIKAVLCPDTLNIDGCPYAKDSNSKENEGFIGFFDWLRTDEFTIVGIRICYLESQPYNRLLMSFPYIQQTFGGRCMELLFEGEDYIPDISGDQDFANNYVFKSEGGDYLFTFGLDHLSDGELNSLLRHCNIISNTQ